MRHFWNISTNTLQKYSKLPILWSQDSNSHGNRIHLLCHPVRTIFDPCPVLSSRSFSWYPRPEEKNPKLCYLKNYSSLCVCTHLVDLRLRLLQSFLRRDLLWRLWASNHCVISRGKPSTRSISPVSQTTHNIDQYSVIKFLSTVQYNNCLQSVFMIFN